MEELVEVRPLYSIYADDPVVETHLNNFVTSMPQIILNCKNMIAKNDWVSLSRYFHKINGSYSTYGYPELQELAAYAELIIRAKDDLKVSEKKVVVSIVSNLEDLSIRANRVIEWLMR